MRSLIRYFVRNHVFYIFLILEIFSLVLLFRYNNYQKVAYLNSTNRVSASIYGSFNSVINYFQLRRVNEDLAEENSKLLNQINILQNELHLGASFLEDTSLHKLTYSFTNAKVINNTVFKQNNYITINKGLKDGIKPGQGIISDNNVIGVISNTSNSYAIGLSLLNMRLLTTAKLKKNEQKGSVNWDGKDYRYIQLNEIPFHVELAKGDTVVTSGFSSKFPEGILIGTIHSFEQERGENFYTVSVELAADFRSLSFVQVITNLNLEEIQSLTNLNQGDENLD